MFSPICFTNFFPQICSQFEQLKKKIWIRISRNHLMNSFLKYIFRYWLAMHFFLQISGKYHKWDNLAILQDAFKFHDTAFATSKSIETIPLGFVFALPMSCGLQKFEIVFLFLLFDLLLLLQTRKVWSDRPEISRYNNRCILGNQ